MANFNSGLLGPGVAFKYLYQYQFLVQALNGFITLHDGFKAGPSLIVRLLIDLHILVKDRNSKTLHFIPLNSPTQSYSPYLLQKELPD